MLLSLLALNLSSLFLPSSLETHSQKITELSVKCVKGKLGAFEPRSDKNLAEVAWRERVCLGVLGSERWGRSRAGAGGRWRSPNGSGAIGGRRRITTLF